MNLLTLKIQNELSHRGITDYHIVDESVSSPRSIEVAANEAVFVHNFHLSGRSAFSINLTSATKVVNYNENNCHKSGGEFVDFVNDTISAHWGAVTVDSNADVPFLIQYVRVIF